jgi:transcriptional regulator with XRE-family HTH domain
MSQVSPLATTSAWPNLSHGERVGTGDNESMSESAELGAMLRAWRGRVHPGDVGSPFGRGSQKTPGLRREEVAWLAGVSPDYVKRLEQGRSHPSRSVIRAIARALRLSDAEYELACRLAGHASHLQAEVPQHITPSVQRLLDRLPDVPIAIFDAAWTRIEQNALWTGVTGDHRERPHRGTNIVWRTFRGDTGPVRHPNPEQYKHSLVADLRDVTARYPDDDELTGMVRDLRSASIDFNSIWGNGAVGHHGGESKIIDHPIIGPIELDCDVLTVHGSDLRIILFTAPPRSAASESLRLLSVLGTENLTPSLGAASPAQ